MSLSSTSLSVLASLFYYFLSTVVAGGNPARGAQKPPHIVVALIDDLGWNGFNLHGGNAEVKAPTIEALASSGIVLENYYVYQFCSPSRAAFLTGRVPGHGIWQINPSDTAAVGINLKAAMLPQVLKRAGYTTHQIGKWHQGFYAPQFTPRGRGFDTSFGFLMGGEDHFTSCQACPNQIPAPDYANHSISCPPSPFRCMVKCPQDGGVDLYRNDGPALGENGTYTAYLWAREAARVIEENDGSPMFMYLALHNVHQPVEAPAEFLQRFPEENYEGQAHDRRYYNAMHFSVDRVIANVTAALKRKGMYENTILIISTDNGGSSEHHGPVKGSSNWPLRGHKYSYFEGGVRGTAVVHSPMLPDKVRGTRSKALLHITDWRVTACNLAGLGSDCGGDELQRTAPHDGINAWPLLLAGEPTPPRPASAWASEGGLGQDEILLGVAAGKREQKGGALRQGHLKFVITSGQADGWSAQYPGTTPAVPAPTTPDGKPQCHEAQPCLFNITADPREMHDMAVDHPDTVRAMERRLRELSTAMSVPNGGEQRFAELEWVNGYHVPRVAEPEACEAMKRKGFWVPWKQEPGSWEQMVDNADGPPMRFHPSAVLI